MTRADPLFKLRLPNALRVKLEEAAMANGQSLTGEILARLAATLPADPGRLAGVEADIRDLKTRMADLERQLAQLVGRQREE